MKKSNNKIPFIQQIILKTGKDVTSIYDKADVTLLADTNASFFVKCYEEWKNETIFSVSLPGFIWDAGLSYPKLESKIFKKQTCCFLRLFLELKSQVALD